MQVLHQGSNPQPPSARTRAKTRVAHKRETDTTEVLALSLKNTPGQEEEPQKKPKRTRPVTSSPYFAKLQTPSRPVSALKGLSCVPFPPLTASSFGLAQERLRDDPFKLLIACVFLTKTRGAVSMPVFYDLIQKYPDAVRLAEANLQDVVDIFAHLGLQNQRAVRVIKMAQAYSQTPPRSGVRFRCLNYPSRGDGKDIKPGESIDDDDERIGWEL